MEDLSSSEVELKVCRIIADSLFVDLEDVQLKSNLVRMLGAESIDLLDIIFRLEKEFAIKLPQREIQKLVREGITSKEFEIDSILQEKGAARLRQLFPEIPAHQIKAGMPLSEIPTTLTVEVFANIVKRKINGTAWEPVSQKETLRAKELV